MGCVFALGLVINLHAQDQTPPATGTFYSAKDPDIAPLPFNRHPECEVTEIRPGVFIVDDTAIPDTPEQVAARMFRQAAARPAQTAAQSAAQQAAIAKAQQADFETNYAPWIVQDATMPDSSPLTWDALAAQNQTNLLSLSTNIANDTVSRQKAINAFIENNPGTATSWTDANGNLVSLDGIDESGGPLFKMVFNVESAQTVSAQKLWPGGSSGFNLTGTNVLMGEWDGGDVQTNHQEFWLGGFRVSLLGSPTNGVSWHATHVAGTLAAWGGYPPAEGFANHGRVLEHIYTKDLSEMPGVVATNAMRVSNHSYGFGAGWFITLSPPGTNAWLWAGNDSIGTNQDYHFGFYDSTARTNDQIIYTAQTYLPVFAAGNSRDNNEFKPPAQPFNHWEFTIFGGNTYWVYTNGIRPLNDAQGGFNNLANYAVSKNALVVGAVNVNTNGYTGTNSVVMSGFSSWGPVADGRIKPDICAAGTNIFSTYATNWTVTNLYAYAYGTSMAAPAATGTLGLLVGLYNQLYGTNYPPMLSSTLAGIVIHTADQTGTNLGPNYRFGWGQLNALSAANLISNNFASGSLAFIKEVLLTNGDYIQFPVVLTNNKPFKVTIRWTDPPGTPVAPAINPTNHMLVNDLDLRVISPNGATTNYPWVLNRNLPASGATTGDNTVDNVEQVSIPNPTSGIYQIRVTHKGSLVNDLGQTNSQNVSIMLSGNIAQPPALPKITAISALTTLNTVALKWASDVGRIYRVQANNDLTTTNWQYASGELSATKTNTAFAVSVAGIPSQFYRIVQVR